uniref:Secreted protein n=1 Tax=Caenorhabditis tropicalis TaxID=1561998 RepID=A0A1I7T2M6_9PELO
MLLKILLFSMVFATISNALVTVPSDTKVSIYDFCSYKVPCAPGHLCHEGFCIQTQSYEYESLPRSLFYRSLFRR